MNAPLTAISYFPEEVARCRTAQERWAALSIRERLRPVRAFRHLLAEQADRLALTVTQDIGRPDHEVLVTDILPTADACLFLERHAARLLRPRRVPSGDRPVWLMGSRDTIHRRPHGVAAIIGTWNYPIFLNAVQIMQALAAGNGVLWKPSELTPTFADFLHELIMQAGFPRDLFTMLPADREIGPKVCEADIDYLVFTGSADVGRKIARRLGERLIPSTLELSGCDALIVLADADVKMAARAAWFGVVLNKGQTCLAVRRIFVHSSVCIELNSELKLLAGRVQAEPLALFSQAEQAERLVRSAVEEGSFCLFPDELPVAENDPPRFPPTVIAVAHPQMAICREASFAPIAGLISFDTIEELLEAQTACPYGLGASIFTANPRAAEKLAAWLPVGSVTINDVITPTAHPATPFGGRRESGWGVTQGAEGLLAMTVSQVVTVRSGRFRPHYDSGQKIELGEMMRGLLRWKHAARFRDRLAGFWRLLQAGRRWWRHRS